MMCTLMTKNLITAVLWEWYVPRSKKLITADFSEWYVPWGQKNWLQQSSENDVSLGTEKLITAVFWEWCVHRWQKTNYSSLLGMLCTLMTARRWLTFSPPTCFDSLHQVMDLRFSTIPAMTCPRHSETPVHIQCLYSLENSVMISFFSEYSISRSHPSSNHTLSPILD